MSSTDRQNRLLLTEDWKKIYQSFKYADFQSYDFDNLRRTMISYIRENYPEDFTDYIESSEYIALIDLIAFLGQNLAFRTDLNARENFIETAERRESILRLARLISYNSSRNIPASGLLKVVSVSTTEDIFDSSNNNLSNQTVLWNDDTNGNWYEQFIKILNAAMPTINNFTRPIKKSTINGIQTEQYKLNAANTDVPVYSFSKSVDGKTRLFEITSAQIDDDLQDIVEEPPLQGNKISILYRDSGQGAGNSNTGFFMHFKQGSLKNNVFALANPTPNTVVNVDTDNINNSDVWLYKLDSNNFEDELWTKVSAIEGNNIIYNSISKNVRSIYTVQSRINDRISITFSDGTFGELPKGTFKVYYRTSDNENYRIYPTDMTNVSVQIPYVSRAGQTETLNLILELQYTVENADTTESNESIQTNAPSTYYTQNRLITGEDYNVGPLGVSQEIIKVKSVNRTSSGISRYYDLRDATGKYSNTLMFGDDGSIYRENLEEVDSFEFTTKTDIESVVNNQITQKIKDIKTRNFYLKNFDRNNTIAEFNYTWLSTTIDTNRTTGKFVDQFDVPVNVSSFTDSIMKFVEPNALVKFDAPEGFYFDKDNKLNSGIPNKLGDKTYIWSKVISVYEAGTETQLDGLGPITFNDRIEDGCKIVEIIPKFTTEIDDDTTQQIVDQAFAYKTFGLRYDTETRLWKIITNANLDSTSSFSLGKTGNNSNQQLDASWLMLFETNGEKYTVTTRGVRYIFQSDEQIRFYFDGADKIYDSRTGKIVKDTIGVLSNNNQPDSLTNFTRNFRWQVTNAFKNTAGYIDNKKLEISFFDSDDDGVIDDPDIFDIIVAPDVSSNTKYIFAKKFVKNGSEVFDYVDQDENKIVILASESAIGSYTSYDSDTVFYIVNKDIFKVFNSSKNGLILSIDYKAFVGRDKIRFDYYHAAAENRRIDPSSSNIIDLYLLTKNYDIDYRKWIEGDLNTAPLPPSSDSLFIQYGSEINKIKSISDEVVYHSVRYKPIIGSKSDEDLQATIKIVKNPDMIINDNEIKAKVIEATNNFFALENWDFGETFYFSELAAFVVNELAPELSSIVLVPKNPSQSFGSLYEIKSENNEIFISSATVEDVEIIDSITAARLQASGVVVTVDDVLNTGVQSSESSINYIITGGDS
mgnify:CR=1 FL=1